MVRLRLGVISAATTDANSGVINMGTMAVDGTVSLLTPNSTGAANDSE